MNQKKHGGLLAFAAAAIWLSNCALSSVATADALYCVGTVSNVYSRSNGLLAFKAGFRGDYVSVCSVTSPWNGIDPALCKNWHATLLTAQVSGAVVSVFFPSTPVSSCAAVNTYDGAPAVGYVMLGDTYN